MEALRKLGKGTTHRVLYRVRLLFVLLVLLPILLAAGVSYFQVKASLLNQAYERLHSDNRFHAARLLDNLLDVSNDLKALQAYSVTATEGNLTLHTSLKDKLETLLISGTDPGDYSPLFGDSSPDVVRPVLTDAGTGTPRPVLTVQEPEGRIWMSIPATSGPLGSKTGLLALLKESHLFGDEHEQLLSADLCVLNGSSVLYCTSHAQKYLPDLRAMYEDGLHRDRSSWRTSEGDTIFVHFRDVFLPSHFDTSMWTIVTIEEEGVVFAPIRVFRWLFPPLLAVLVLASLLLVSIHTRRRFEPLEVLMAGAQRLGGGDFKTRMEVKSGDEFEELADSFNSMADKLGNQFGFLTMMSGIDSILLSRPNRYKLAKTIVRQVPEILGIDVFGVLVLEGERPAKLFTYDQDERRAATSRVVNLDETFFSRLASDRIKPFVEERARTEDLCACFREGVDALRVYPLAEGRQLFGALCLNERDVAAFDEEAGEQMGDIVTRLTVAFSAVERQQQLYRQANFDDLTGLPNRALFVDRLEKDIRQASPNLGRVGVIYVDLDRFKVINDTHGHFSGDAVLKETAKRLRALVHESDSVSRLSGDEFVFALPGVRDSGEIVGVVEAILTALDKPFSVNGQDFILNASIGISMYPEDGDCAEELLKNADLAMYRAKASPGIRYRLFEAVMNKEANERAELGQDMLYAIDRGQISVVYQPKVDAVTHRIHSAEALVRWLHPVHGWVSPAKFIPISEETGSVKAIGEFVLRSACEQFARWRRLGLCIEHIAVNISPYQVLYCDLPALVTSELARNELEPHCLELEVTESLLIDDYARSEEVLSKLKSMGISLALDDFGTGYSSLAHIHQLSFDTVKIDKCFLDDLGVRPNAEAIIDSIIAMGESLEKNIVAEGVDNQAQLQYLQSKNCHLYQGYYFSKPLAADELEDLLSSGLPLPLTAGEITAAQKISNVG